MGRQARKLEEQRLLAAKLAEQSKGVDGGGSSEEEDSGTESANATGGQRNLFDLLDDDDGVADENEAVTPPHEIAVDDDHRSTSSAEAKSEPMQAAPKPVAAKKKKKKGKKKKKSKATSTPGPDQDDVEAVAAAIERDEDNQFDWEDSDDDRASFIAEVDDMMRSFTSLTTAATPPDTTQTREDLDLLAVDPKLLSSDSELRRLFGADALEFDRATRAGSANAGAPRANRSKLRGAAALRNRRRAALVVPRDDTWRADPPGFAMVVDDDAAVHQNGVVYFKYRHSGGYKEAQLEYYRCLETHDPNSMVALLSRYPCHVDSFIQLAEVHRQTGELDYAAELIERALFVLERAWPAAFKPFDGSCRLRYSIPANRSLFIALFRYMQLLSRRALHRTALEICKLVYLLDPENDPLGSMLCMDSFAVLCKEHQFVLDMGKTSRLAISPHHLVGWRFATVLCRRALAPTEESEHIVELAKVFVEYPMALKPILLVCGPAAKEPGKKLLRKVPFSTWESDVQEDRGLLERLCKVYAERSRGIWGGANADVSLLPFLLQGAEAASRVYSSDRDAVETAHTLRGEALGALLSQEAYSGVQLSDFVDSATGLTPELLNDTTPIGVGQGNLPPGVAGAGSGAGVAASSAAALRTFFTSLMPWATVEELEAAEIEAATRPDGAGPLVNAIQAILDREVDEPERVDQGEGRPTPPREP